MVVFVTTLVVATSVAATLAPGNRGLLPQSVHRAHLQIRGRFVH